MKNFKDGLADDSWLLSRYHSSHDMQSIYDALEDFFIIFLLIFLSRNEVFQRKQKIESSHKTIMNNVVFLYFLDSLQNVQNIWDDAIDLHEW